MVPNLVRCYVNAMQRVYNISPIVPETYNSRFSKLEFELMDHRISSKHYAESQAVMWKPWVDKMGLKSVPLNVFLGVAAKARYNKLLAMPSVEPILDREVELRTLGLSFERGFATWYLDQIMYKHGIRDEGQALDVYLESYTNEAVLYGWLDYCEEYGRLGLVREIVNQFCSYWDIKKVCADYFNLACRYVDKLTDTRRKLNTRLDALDWRKPEYRQINTRIEQINTELDQLTQGLLV